MSVRCPVAGSWPRVGLLAGLLLALVGIGAGAGVATAAEGALEDGGQAARGAWHCAGGSASRSGVSRTPALLGPLEAAWTYEAEGEIEGEPVVYGSAVVFGHVTKAGRALVVLDLETGDVRAKKTFKSRVSLAPCVDDGVIVVRTGDAELQAFRMYPTGIVWFWKSSSSGPVRSFVVLGREAYVRGDNAIVALRVGERKVSWMKRARFRGDVAVRGPHVYGVSYTKAGAAQLSMMDRGTGRTAGEVPVGHHDGAVPGPADGPGLHVFANMVVVRHSHGIPLVSGGEANAVVIPRTVRESGAVSLGKEKRLFTALGAISTYDGRWLGIVEDSDDGNTLGLVAQNGDHYPLASRGAHPQFLSDDLRPTVVGSVAYMAGHAVDLESRRILWSAPELGKGRIVPARDAVLARDTATRLACFRQARPTDAAAPITPAKDVTVQGRAVLRGGKIVRGELKIAPAQGTLGGTLGWEQKGAPKSEPLAGVLLVEDEDERLLHTPGVAPLLRGIEILADQDIARAYAALAKRAGEANDPDLLERLIGEARLRGATARELNWPTARLKLLKKKAGRLQAEKARAVRADEAALPALHAEMLWKRIDGLPEDASDSLRFDMLRELLDRAPEHEGASAVVRGLLPKGIDPKSAFDAGEWLDFVEIVKTTPIKIVEPPTDHNAELTPGERNLGVLLHTWRPDLVGIQSEHLLIVTPLARPGSIARCIAMGELVCNTLDGFFEGGTHRRATTYPLTIQLFESQEEYASLAEDGRISSHTATWSAGHYSPSEEISRLFLPSDDAEFRLVMNVFAHELTHQWVSERCPAFGTADVLNAGPKTPGFWIVEGFAMMIEEFDWDPRTGTWGTARQPESPLLCASAKSEWLLPWNVVLECDKYGYASLNSEPQYKVPDPNSLGMSSHMSEVNLFYAQAGLVALYLFAGDEGKHRSALMEYLGARYRGETPPIEKAFGMKSTDLGRRAIEFARKMK